MVVKINRYYALFSPGHLLLFLIICILTSVVALLSYFQGNGIAIAIEAGFFLLLLLDVFVPLSYTSRLEIDQEGTIIYDRGTLSKLNIRMRHAIKDSYRITTLHGFRFEQNMIERRLNVGRLILCGSGEVSLLDGHKEQEQISEFVIYGITDFEGFKQEFIEKLHKKR